LPFVAGLPEIPGNGLAGFAANENTPVLIISGRPEVNERLERFGYPCLAKTFGLDILHGEAGRIVGESRENGHRVKASARKMHANTGALSAAVEQCGRLLPEIRAQQIARRPVQLPSQSSAPERAGVST
jgi:hypothetical protein